MQNYKELYLVMVRETERAIRILSAAQQTCEDLYVGNTKPKLTLLYKRDKKHGGIPE